MPSRGPTSEVDDRKVRELVNKTKSMSVPALGGEQSLNRYLSEIRKFPVLTETKTVNAATGITSYSYTPDTYVADGEVAGHQIALNFSSMIFMIPYSLGMAATVRAAITFSPFVV